MDNNWADTIERRIVALETRNAVDEVHRINVAQRLGAIEDTLKWLVRLIIGGLLMAALTYLVQGGIAI
ncbi:MAG: hemolysin XhlA family protein [Yoonia sp.]|uniref:hemolysin XhlA family protein n=1 Tax=Yoonia sp. TaxID=2212373 RepID=UPI00273EAEFD|nr:hemolysin XhlA family protein [Yoonia sp.]MDP5085480.1 hemolysin XhlA family protein [Yoonia sp.]MDP5360313.1 hemolysin XhlA family protein [Paracoccaceae bacterium]MDP5362040.1 hemolysin XhlA family protein [Paracoccaceae bacterium]